MRYRIWKEASARQVPLLIEIAPLYESVSHSNRQSRHSVASMNVSKAKSSPWCEWTKSEGLAHLWEKNLSSATGDARLPLKNPMPSGPDMSDWTT